MAEVQKMTTFDNWIFNSVQVSHPSAAFTSILCLRILIRLPVKSTTAFILMIKVVNLATEHGAYVSKVSIHFTRHFFPEKNNIIIWYSWNPINCAYYFKYYGLTQFAFPVCKCCVLEVYHNQHILWTVVILTLIIVHICILAFCDFSIQFDLCHPTCILPHCL